MTRMNEDREPVRGDVRISLAFPMVMGGDPAERAAQQRESAVRIEIHDGPSRMRILELRLTAEEFTNVLRGGDVVVHASMPAEEFMSRIGKTMRHVSTEIHQRGSLGLAAAESKRASYEAEGWESVKVDMRNYGYQVIARRWEDGSAA